MNLKLITLLAIALLMQISCKNEKDKPKVSYNKIEKKEVKIDTTQVEIADLPINFDGTSILIYPIGDLNIYSRGSKSKYESSAATDDEQNFIISNLGDDEITGYLQNLNFQEIGSNTIQSLSDEPILIETVTYLKTIANKTKKQILVYTLHDLDSNQDDKVDANDIKTLYISAINGNGFIKLAPGYQELIDWNCIDLKNQIYFRTIEDNNKNGAFDKADKIHYFTYNLLAKDPKATEYFPVK